MKRWLMSFFLLSALVSGTAAHANDCADEAKDQVELDRCADAAFQNADKELDAALKQLQEKISPAGRERLKAAQEAWRDYRDAQCEFSAFGSIDGTMHPAALAGCYERLTIEQADLLREQLNCEDGDPTCGGQ